MKSRLTIVVALCVAAIFAACGEDAEAPKPGGQAELCPKDDARGLDTNELIGLDLKVAEDEARAGRCSVRVVEEDGEPLAGTSDLRPNRINVEVRDDEVVRIDGVY